SLGPGLARPCRAAPATPIQSDSSNKDACRTVSPVVVPVCYPCRGGRSGRTNGRGPSFTLQKISPCKIDSGARSSIAAKSNNGAQGLSRAALRNPAHQQRGERYITRKSWACGN